jgi:predicted RNA binding protein YcfA (HicA-like mRNA interferase family)
MPLKPLAYREVRKRLLSLGFQEVAAKGSHVKFSKVEEAGTRTAIVPSHREVAVGTIRSILRQAGITEDVWNGLA